MPNTLDPTERVILRVRRHPFVIITESSALMAAAFLPVILFPFFSRQDWLGLPGNPVFLFFALVSAWTFLLWIVFYKMWLSYYLDVWVLTDRKLIDVEQKSLFRREVSTLLLERIQDVVVKVEGIVPSLLKFGEIWVQTAGASREFQMHQIREPYRVKEAVLKAQQEVVKRYRMPPGF